jgi:hypothetical protein
MCIKWFIEYFQRRNVPKPQPPEEKKWCKVFMNNDFLNVQTRSGYRSYVFDSDGENIFLPPDFNAVTLGESVLKALSKSRIIDPKDFGVFFDRDRLQNQYNEWINYCKKTYGYKTKKAMFRDIKNLDIELYNRKIIMRPWHQEKPEIFGPTKNKELDNVIISTDSTPEEIGRAVHLALSRCTSEVS